MVDSRAVSDHYEGGRRPIDAILDGLAAAGIERSAVTSADLAGVDEFHLGGRTATAALLDDLELGPHSRVLDVGCGVGGPARTIAESTGCRVRGVDLTPVFVEAAVTLTELVGLSDRVSFVTGDVLAIDPADGRYDAVTMLHVGMNLPDKDVAVAALADLLVPGGTLCVYDIMTVGPGELQYPMPWASSAETSFPSPPEVYRAAMAAAGLEPGAPVDRSALAAEALAAVRESPPAVNLGHLMGPEFPTMISNLAAAMQAGTVAPVSIVASRPSG